MLNVCCAGSSKQQRGSEAEKDAEEDKSESDSDDASSSSSSDDDNDKKGEGSPAQVLTSFQPIPQSLMTCTTTKPNMYQSSFIDCTCINHNSQIVSSPCMARREVHRRRKDKEGK